MAHLCDRTSSFVAEIFAMHSMIEVFSKDIKQLLRLGVNVDPATFMVTTSFL